MDGARPSYQLVPKKTPMKTRSLYLPSGKRLQFANLKMAIEIVDLSIKNGDFPWLC